MRRCAELGIAVDLSHLNAAGFWDVARTLDGPLIASHSGVHALCPSTRNLTDDQLDAIAASGGLVGINFDVGSLRADGADDADTPVERIAEHARYVADRCGVDHVALGSDFDGATMPAEVPDAAGAPARARRPRGRGLRGRRGGPDRLRQLAPRAGRCLALARSRAPRRDASPMSATSRPSAAIPATTAIAGRKTSSDVSPLTTAVTIARPIAPPSWNDVFTRPGGEALLVVGDAGHRLDVLGAGS